ncbi:ATP-binding protein, partial [Actinomadura darangshiensis]
MIADALTAVPLGTRRPHPAPTVAPSPSKSPSQYPRRAPADSPLGRLVADPLGTLAHWWDLATQFLLAHLPLVIVLGVTGITLIAAVRSLMITKRHTHLAAGARVVQVQVPPQVDPPAAAAWWANLIGLLRPRWRRIIFGQPHVAFEYCWTGTELAIQVWVCGPVPAGLVARAVEAAWPAARTQVLDPQLLVPAGAVTASGTLRLARPDHHPIAADQRTDPIRALLGAASGLSHGQRAVVQVLARPATGSRLARAAKAAAVLRGAHHPNPVGRLLDLLTPGMSSRSPRPATVAAAHPERAGEIRAILDKAAAPRFEVAVHYSAATSVTADEQAARAWARGRAHALASAFAVFSGRNYFERHRLRRAAEIINSRQMRRGDLLSIGELAAVAHLPYDPAVPGLSRAGANAVPPPPAVPAGGHGTKPLGDSDAGAARPVAVRVSDSRQHLHVVGATGSGKSTLLAQMILADAAAGRAAVVIDPRGDLINDLLGRLPDTASSRVWLIDPDTTPPPALSVLSGPDANLVSDNLVGIVHRIFADSWGPRTDDILRSAVLTLQQVPRATLADVPRLLTRDAYRIRAVHRIGDDDILAGFWSWYAGLSPEARANAIGPVMNKLRHFLLRPFVRQIVGTPGPGLNTSRLLDHDGILLVRVPKGTLGDDTARLLGSIVLAKVWETTTARAYQDEATRRDAALYVDEAHAFLNLPHGIEEMLAEARAYRLSMTLAHQNLTQFPPSMRDAVAANARNKIFFATSPQDARDLAHMTWPNLTDHDLANLGAYQAAARLIISSQETPAFTLTTRPLPPETPGRAETLRQAARRNAEPTRQPPRLPDPR